MEENWRPEEVGAGLPGYLHRSARFSPSRPHRVLDHLIVAVYTTVSFAEQGLL